MAKDASRVKRRERKNITSGVAHVNSTFNNTMITISDAQGNTISWSSAGAMGFKGSRKSTPFAAQMAGEDAGKKAAEHGMKTLKLRFVVLVQVVNLPCVLCRQLASPSLLSVMYPQFHITAVVRASVVASNWKIVTC